MPATMQASVVTTRCPVCGSEAVGVAESHDAATFVLPLARRCEHAGEVDLALADVALGALPPLAVEPQPAGTRRRG